MSHLKERREEFEANIWNHAEDPFQMQFDQRRPLNSSEIDCLRSVVAAVEIPQDAKALKALREAITSCDDGAALVLQIVGLTRSKIISDLKAGAPSGAIPSSYRGIIKDRAWDFAGPYLLWRLRSVFRTAPLTSGAIDNVLEALNQATWPGFIRQERAKRSGHEAEGRLATLLATLEIPFEPKAKAENPLCPDVQIEGVSFDLVVPSVAKPKLVVKATVHTANIGQFGESKDDLEVREAKRLLDRSFAKASRPSLVALIDGIGCLSNRAGLDGVLTNADEFCQFKTIWKAAVMGAIATKTEILVELETQPSPSLKAFIARWGAEKMVTLVSKLKSAEGWTQAGDALIRRKK